MAKNEDASLQLNKIGNKLADEDGEGPSVQTNNFNQQELDEMDKLNSKKQY